MCNLITGLTCRVEKTKAMRFQSIFDETLTYTRGPNRTKEPRWPNKQQLPASRTATCSRTADLSTIAFLYEHHGHNDPHRAALKENALIPTPSPRPLTGLLGLLGPHDLRPSPPRSREGVKRLELNEDPAGRRRQESQTAASPHTQLTGEINGCFFVTR